RNYLAIEDAELLIWQPTALNAVYVENGCMRGKTRPYCRHGILPCPVENLGERTPVWLVLQIRDARLGTGYNQPIEAHVPQLRNVTVLLCNLAPHMIGTRNIGD